jgi:hypothetical protein
MTLKNSKKNQKKFMVLSIDNHDVVLVVPRYNYIPDDLEI